jgi:hypothetical protein
MFELLYSSEALVHLDPDEMESFLGHSRARNEAADITGFLFHLHGPGGRPGFFVQVLEGPEVAVEETYARIGRDPLHTDVTTMDRRRTGTRAFRDWAMRLESITGDQARAAVARTGTPVEAGVDLGNLLWQPRFTRSLVAAFRTVTPTAGAQR